MKFEYHTLYISAPQLAPPKYMKNNDHRIDGVQLARDIQATIENLSAEGWELFQTIPVQSTKYLQITFTEGVTMIFRKQV